MNHNREMKILDNISRITFFLCTIWFTLDLIGIPGFVVRDDLFSLAGLLEAGLLILCIGYVRHWKYTDYPAILILILWGYFQYAAHWQYYFLGASADQIKRYNKFYTGMYHFFSQSSTKIIPDAYHTVLAGLIILNIAIIVIKFISRIKAVNRL